MFSGCDIIQLVLGDLFAVLHDMYGIKMSFETIWLSGGWLPSECDGPWVLRGV
jgi:hypothetical protein